VPNFVAIADVADSSATRLFTQPRQVSLKSFAGLSNRKWLSRLEPAHVTASEPSAGHRCERAAPAGAGKPAEERRLHLRV
jgi:hypothetical protein